MIVHVLRVYGVPIAAAKCGQRDADYAVVEFGVVIWAKAKNVADNIGAVMRGAQRLNVVSFGVKRSVWELDGVAATLNLAFVLVHGFRAAGKVAVA